MSRLKLTAVALMLFVVSACEVPDPSASERVPSRKVPSASTRYRYGSSPVQTLRVFKPSKWRSSNRRPVVVYAHGGAWVAGTSTDLDPMVLELLAAGAVVVSVDYRLGVPAAVQVDDILAAARWAEQNRSKIGGDPSKIFLAGHSAGGHLALLAGLSDNLGSSARPSAGFRGVFAAAAPVDLDDPAFDPDIMGFSVQSVLAGVNACPASPCPASVLSFLSPDVHVDASDPPVYYVAGAVDPVVPVSHGRSLAEAFAAAGVPDRLWLDVVEAGDHQPGIGAHSGALRQFLASPPR